MNTNCRKPFLKFWKILLFPFLNFIYLFFKDFIYLSEREWGTESAQVGGGAGRGRSWLPAEQGAGCWTLDSIPMTLAEGRCLTNWATHVSQLRCFYSNRNEAEFIKIAITCNDKVKHKIFLSITITTNEESNDGINEKKFWDAWVAQSFKHLPLAQVMIPVSWAWVLHRAPCSPGNLLLRLPAPPRLCSLSLTNK